MLNDLARDYQDNLARQLKWDRRFLEVAKVVSTWSKDPSTQVGAVLVDETNVIVGTGYNGFPRGVSDSADRYNDRAVKYEMVVHAEVNAILTAGHRARGATLYVFPAFGTPCICANCAKAAIQAGVRCVVGHQPNPADAERAARWADTIKLARDMFTEAGVKYRAVPLATGGRVTIKNDGGGWREPTPFTPFAVPTPPTPFAVRGTPPVAYPWERNHTPTTSVLPPEMRERPTTRHARVADALKCTDPTRLCDSPGACEARGLCLDKLTKQQRDGGSRCKPSI